MSCGLHLHPLAPTDGYRVLITRESTTTTVNVVGTSHTISVNNQYGVYSIQVIALSRPLPSEATEPVEVTVIGNFYVRACTDMGGGVYNLYNDISKLALNIINN